MCKELTEAKFKELKESLITMPHHIENISNEIEIIRKRQKEIQELKSTITDRKKLNVRGQQQMGAGRRKTW